MSASGTNNHAVPMPPRRIWERAVLCLAYHSNLGPQDVDRLLREIRAEMSAHSDAHRH